MTTTHKDVSRTTIILVVLVLLLLALPLFLDSGTLIGFLTFTPSENVQTIPLDQNFSDSQTPYTFPFALNESISSLAVTGYTQGYGQAKLIATNGTHNWTVFSFIRMTPGRTGVANQLTGMVTGQRLGIVNPDEIALTNDTNTTGNETIRFEENNTQIDIKNESLHNLSSNDTLTLNDSIVDFPFNEANGSINETIDDNETYINIDMNGTNTSTDLDLMNVTVDTNLSLNDTLDVNLTDETTELNVTSNETVDVNVSINETNVAINETIENVTELPTDVKSFVNHCEETCKFDAVSNLSLELIIQGDMIVHLDKLMYIPLVRLEQIQNFTDMNISTNETLQLDLFEYFGRVPGLIFDVPYVEFLNTSIVDGQYLQLSSERPGKYGLFVYATTGDQLLRSNIFTVTVSDELNVTLNETVNETLNQTWNGTVNDSLNRVLGPVVVGEDVTWEQVVPALSNESVVKAIVPEKAKDVRLALQEGRMEVQRAGQDVSLVVDRLGVASDDSSNLTAEEVVPVNYTVHYELPGPQAQQETLSSTSKRYAISSSYHYENVLARTVLPEPAPLHLVDVYWVENDSFLQATGIDADNDGLVEEIEWIIPHLSNQTFIINLTVLNPIEYLRDGDTWDVRFETVGTGNLTIWSENAAWEEELTDTGSVDEMEFLDIACGDESLKDELVIIDESNNYYNYNELTVSDSIKPDKFLIEDYNCTDIGHIKNYMNIAGYATLELEFRNENMVVKDRAIDPDPLNGCETGSVEGFYETTFDPATSTCTITMQPDATDGKDAPMRYGEGSLSERSDWNFGASDYLNVGRNFWIDYQLYRFLINFNLSSFNDSLDNTTSSEMKLYLHNTYDLDVDVSAYVLRRNWGEGDNDGSTADTGESSWNDYEAPNGWFGGGASNTAGDRYPSAEDTVSLTTSDSGWIAWNVTTAMNKFLNGSITNNGFVFIGSTAGSYGETGVMSFRSSDYTTDSSQRPKLIINYTGSQRNETPILALESIDGNNDTSSTLNCSTTLANNNLGPLNITVRWYRDGVQYSQTDYNNSYPDNTFVNITLNSSITAVFDSWLCSMRTYNGTDYSNWGNSTSLSIVNNPPVMESVSISPAFPNAADNLFGYCNASEADASNVTYYWRWYKNDELNLSDQTADNYTQGMQINVGNITSGNLTLEDNWTLSCKATDSYLNSSWLNSTTVEILLANGAVCTAGDNCSSGMCIEATCRAGCNSTYDGDRCSDDAAVYDASASGICARNFSADWSCEKGEVASYSSDYYADCYYIENDAQPGSAYQCDTDVDPNYSAKGVCAYDGAGSTMTDISCGADIVSFDSAVYYLSCLTTDDACDSDVDDGGYTRDGTCVTSNCCSSTEAEVAYGVSKTDTDPDNYCSGSPPLGRTCDNDPSDGIALEGLTTTADSCCSGATYFAFGSGATDTTPYESCDTTCTAGKTCYDIGDVAGGFADSEFGLCVHENACETGAVCYNASTYFNTLSSCINTSTCDNDINTSGYVADGIVCGGSCVGSASSDCCTDGDCSAGNVCESYTCVPEDPPNITDATLGTSSTYNLSTEPLVLALTGSHPQGYFFTNITDWRESGSSLALMNLPFDTQVTTTSSGAVLDYSTNDNSATLAGSAATPTWNSSGRVGGAYYFDGGDYMSVACGDGGFCDFGGNTFTVEAWVKTTGTSIDIISAGGGGDHWRLGVDSRGEGFFSYNNGDQTSQSSDTNYTVNDGSWHHIVGVRDGLQTGMIYIDGLLRHDWDLGGSTTSINIADDLYIGARTTTTYRFTGLIDEVKVYTGVLTPDYINASYKAGLKNKHLKRLPASQTSVGDVWTVAVTPTDSYNNGSTVTSNSLTILSNTKATITSANLSSTSAKNYTTDNITVSYTGVSDSDGHEVSNITDWRLNGTSIALLNFPFDTNNESWGSDAVTDYSSFAKHARLYGDVQWTPDGQVGGAYYFDGDDDYILVSADNFNNLGNVSFEFWFKPDETINSATGQYYYYIDKQGDFAVFHDASSDAGRIRFLTYSGNIQTATDSWTADTWYHIAGVHYNSSLAYIYVNGELDNYNNGYSMGSMSDDTDSVYFGIDSDGGEDFLGYMDEIRIYNRTLSHEQVYRLYQDGLSGKHPETIVSNETSLYDNWTVVVTPNDKGDDGSSTTASLSIVDNSPPSLSNATLTSTSATNLTSDNLSVSMGSITDTDGDAVTNITDWRVNSTSIAVLNMPFDTHITSTAASAVNDYSSFDNDGQLGGGNSSRVPAWTSDCVVGGCYDFDGENDYVEIENSVSLVNNHTNKMTIIAWINPSLYPSSGYAEVIRKEKSFHLSYSASLESWDFGFKNQSNSNMFNGYFNKSYVPEDSWTNLVLSYNGSHISRYINGELNATNTSIFIIGSNNNNNLYIGNYGTSEEAGSLSRYFNGSIDEVLIVNRSLSAEQIKAIYDAGLAGHQLQTVASNETSLHDNWTVVVTPNDAYNDGDAVTSNWLQVSNGIPAISTVTLASTSGNNFSSDNLTVTFGGVSDDDGDAVTNITDWRVNSTSIAVLNMPFDTHITSTAASAVNDYSSFDNDGQLGGGNSSRVPAWTSDCVVGGCYDFDSTDDYIDLPDLATFTSYTVSAWAKFDAVNTGSRSSIMAVKSDNDFSLREDGNGSVTFGQYNGSAWVTVSTPIAAGTWNHLTGSWNGTHIFLYVNGTLLDTNNIELMHATSNRNDAIGADNENPSNEYWMNGSIDEVLIVNRSLSAEQIKAIYDAGLAGHQLQTVASNETSIDDVWTVSVTPNDALDDGDSLTSAGLLVDTYCLPPASGDWNITDSQHCRNRDITLTDGGLYVKNGGLLTLENVTFMLTMDSDYVYPIDVDSGAELRITDGSLITEDGDNNVYFFYNDGFVQINDSNLSDRIYARVSTGTSRLHAANVLYIYMLDDDLAAFDATDTNITNLYFYVENGNNFTIEDFREGVAFTKDFVAANQAANSLNLTSSIVNNFYLYNSGGTLNLSNSSLSYLAHYNYANDHSTVSTSEISILRYQHVAGATEIDDLADPPADDWNKIFSSTAPNTLSLSDTNVTDIFVFSDYSDITISNSTFDRFLSLDDSNALLINSSVTEQSRFYASSINTFKNSSIDVTGYSRLDPTTIINFTQPAQNNIFSEFYMNGAGTMTLDGYVNITSIYATSWSAGENLHRYFPINVTTPNGDPYAGADVELRNAAEVVQSSGQTDSDGLISLDLTDDDNTTVYQIYVDEQWRRNITMLAPTAPHGIEVEAGCIYTTDKNLTGNLSCGDLTVYPFVTLNTSVYTITATGEATINGTLDASMGGPQNFGSLRIPSGGEYKEPANQTTITSEDANGYAVDIDGVYTSNTGNLTINTADSTTIDLNDASDTVYDLVIATTDVGNIVTADSAFDTANDLVIQSGTFSAGAFHHDILGDFIKTGGRLTMGSSSLSDLDISGNLLSTGGDISDVSATYIYVDGNVTITGLTLDMDQTRLRMDGASNATINSSQSQVGNYLYLYKPSGYEVKMLSNLSSGHIIHNDCVFDINGYDMDAYGVYYGYSGAILKMDSGSLEVAHDGYAGGTFSPFYLQNGWSEQISGGTITLYGSIHGTYGTMYISSTADFTPTGGTFELVGTDDAIIEDASGSANFYDLLITRTGKVVTANASNINVTNLLNVSAGTLNITDAYNLTISSLDVGDSFEMGSGTLTRSSPSGYWSAYLDDATSYTFFATDISFGNNTGNAVIDARSAVDGGNNVPSTMWNFQEINVTLLRPLNGSVTADTILFECNASDDINLTNISLYYNNSGLWERVNTSALTTTLASASFTNTGFQEINFSWLCEACDSLSCMNSTAYTAIVDTTDPSISYVLPTPADTVRVLSSGPTINISSSDEQTDHSVLVDLNNSLVAWLTFDNTSAATIYDKTSNGHNGSLQNEAYLIDGSYGRGVQLDGTNDYVLVDSDEDFILNESGTIEAWVRLDTLSGSYDNVIIMKGDGSSWGNLHYVLIEYSGTDEIAFSISNGTDALAASSPRTATLQADTWYHIAATWNETTKCIYRNGVQDECVSSTLMPASTMSGCHVNVGRAYANNYYLDGTIDEVRFHSRALKPTEVNASYQAHTYAYDQLFSGLLGVKSYSLQAHAIDKGGNVVSEEQRSFTVNTKPTMTSASLAATSSENLTTDNLTITFAGVSDDDSDTVFNITDWRVNSTSIATLNMPFDTNVSSAHSGAVKDYSTNQNNGTLGAGTPANAPSWQATGQVGGSYRFDGSDDYISTASNPYLSCSSDDCNSPVTISVWIKLNNSSQEAAIAGRFDSDGSDHWYNYGSGIKYVNGNVSVMSRYNGDNDLLTSTLTDTSAWHHVVAVIHTPNGKLYVDGELQDSGDLNSGYIYDFCIGAQCNAGTSFHFNGLIDELLIFDKELSAEQVKVIYDAGVAGQHLETIFSNETAYTDTWSVAVTPTDSYEDGDAVNSDTLLIGDKTKITDCQTLQNINNYLDDTSSTYVLQNDIDCDVAPFNTGEGFTPIGNTTNHFNATFQGAGHAITGLFINQSHTLGLFGSVGETGQVSNLTLNNTFISATGGASASLAGRVRGTITDVLVNDVFVEVAGHSSGGVIGVAYVGSVIDNVTASDVTIQSTSGSSSSIGGVVGYLAGTIQNSRLSGVNVTGGIWQTGGFVGSVIGSDGEGFVYNCSVEDGIVVDDDRTGSFAGWTYNGGKIYYSFVENVTVDPPSSLYSVGGFIGLIYGLGSAVYDSYAQDFELDEGGKTGGFVGEYHSGGPVTRSYTTVNVSDTTSFYGGFTGSDGGNTYTDTFWDGDTSDATDDSDQGDESGVTKSTTAAMKTLSTYTDASWDMSENETGNSVWVIAAGGFSYPLHRWLYDDLEDQDSCEAQDLFWYDGACWLHPAFPYFGSVNLLPIAPYENDTLVGYCNATDFQDDAITYHYRWYRNNTFFSAGTSAGTYSSAVNANVANMSSDNTTFDDTWIFSCKGSDGTNNGTWLNSTGRTIPPELLIVLNNTFVNWTNEHSFNVTSGISYGADASEINRSLEYSGGICTYLSNVTNAGLLNVTYNCTGTPFTTASMNMTFCDRMDICVTTPTSSNEYPNQAPSLSSLLTPTDENDTLTNRNVSFTWNVFADPESDDVNYSINVTNEFCPGFVKHNLTTNSYNHDELLNTSFECENKWYFWSVRACDEWNCSNFTTQWNFSIEDYLALSITTATVNFTDMQLEQSNDTTDDEPSPFVIENVGNIRANMFNVTATDLWSATTLGTSYYRFKVNNASEPSSFDWANSATSWLSMTESGNNQVIVANLSYLDDADLVAVDLAITVPPGEPPGSKTSTIRFDWETGG